MMASNDIEWSLTGEYLEACNCDAGCPCKFGADPTQGHCDGIIGFEIKEGHYGSVELDGLRFALLLYAPESPFKGNLRTACYLDERAGQEQREALDKILSGKAGGFWSLISPLVSDNRGIELAQIDMDTTGERRRFLIPGVLELANEPLVNPITGERQEVTVSNTFDPFCASGRAGRSVKAVCAVPDFEYDLTGQQGYSGPFQWAGP
jgi:hypothetical protein